MGGLCWGAAVGIRFSALGCAPHPGEGVGAGGGGACALPRDLGVGDPGPPTSSLVCPALCFHFSCFPTSLPSYLNSASRPCSGGRVSVWVSAAG